MVATSFMLDTSKDLAMFRKAGSGIANAFKAGHSPSGMVYILFILTGNRDALKGGWHCHPHFL